MTLRLSIGLTEDDADLVYVGMDTVADPAWLRQQILEWMQAVAAADEERREVDREKAARTEVTLTDLRRVEQKERAE
jgi:hypothetical protein